MIINVFGPNAQTWLDFLPRQCRVVSKFSGVRATKNADDAAIVDAPAVFLPALAALLRKEPGTRREWNLWDIVENERGDVIGGKRMDDEEFAELDAHETAKAYLLDVRKKGLKPDVVVINPSEHWVMDFMLKHTQRIDPVYDIAFRERRIAETMYYLQLHVPVVLVSGEVATFTGPASTLPNCLSVQTDCSIHVGDVARLVFQREHVGLPTQKGEEVRPEHLLSVLGFLAKVI